jgi:hypothetical protein
MKSRCYRETDVAYERYGGRGIKVCEEWKDDFAAFRDWALQNGYNDTLTIDRIDNDGNYEPSKSMRDITSISAAVKKVIDGYPDGYQFHGNELKDDAVRIYPKSQYSYVDTFLRMARRHRRYAFCVVDQNNSLYKKLYVKPIIEEIKEVAPKEELLAKQPESVRQIELPFLFNQLFLVGFFAVFFGVFLPVVFDFGRPLTPPSLMASKSASLYIPTGPMYLKGWIPFLCSLLLTPSDDMPKILDISNAVIASIYRSIALLDAEDQGINDKMFRIWHILLYNRIVKSKSLDILPINTP